MADSNGSPQRFAEIFGALMTMSSNSTAQQKLEANQYLESFQKNAEAWSTTFAMLQDPQTSVEGKMFAATVLKGKIKMDFSQLPAESYAQLRDSLLELLRTYSKGPKPIRTQLSVALANLAIQMLGWKDVLPFIVSTLGTDPNSVACFLEFLHVLPQELNEGGKVNLGEEELLDRTAELLQQNGPQVLSLLVQYAQSSETAASDPLLMECISSWVREIPLQDVLQSPLLNIITQALRVDHFVDEAADSMWALISQTDPNETIDSIKILFPELLALRPSIAQAAADGDASILQGLTRIYSEAGDRWAVLIARQPVEFHPLVECILECAQHDHEREAMRLSFGFWEDLKQLLTLDRYMEARLQYVDIYSKLVDHMVHHLQWPVSESDKDSTDPFAGDREAEDKFREFRHIIGDVLKDCTEVIGVTECLKKIFNMIQAWVGVHGSSARSGSIPEWQKLEAALFSFRAIGRMVPDDESIMLSQLIPLLVQIPDHNKVRFQAVMALGRYTAWSAKHPETLESQLDFIIAAFQHGSDEVQEAAALSFRFFCQDCADLLVGHVTQLQQFYESVIDRLPRPSQEEVTEGIALVIARVQKSEIHAAFKASCDPLMNRVMQLAQKAVDKESKDVLADHIRLISIFISNIRVNVEPGKANPAVQYCQEIFPALAALSDKFCDSRQVLETVCACWRKMVMSYRTDMAPLLPDLASKLTSGFEQSRQGCFLWASGLIVREFTSDAPNVDQQTLQAIFAFFEQQATNFLRVLSAVAPEELDDVIEDFFRLSIDALMYHPYQYIASPLLPSILSAVCASLALLNTNTLTAILHFLRDLLGYATPDPPTSLHDQATGRLVTQNPPQVQEAVKAQLNAIGETLTQRVMTGMMYTFPVDCFPDASGVLLALFQICPVQTAGWVQTTVTLLPADSITPAEQEKLMRNINQRIQAHEPQKIRSLLQDFTNSYRRRNVAPRGLGRLEASRFRFSG